MSSTAIIREMASFDKRHKRLCAKTRRLMLVYRRIFPEGTVVYDSSGGRWTMIDGLWQAGCHIPDSALLVKEYSDEQ